MMRAARFILPGACALVLAGCWSSDNWDREFVCRGEERSTTHLQGHPASENYEKVYPAEVDFHIRSDAVLVKSHQVDMRMDADKRITFNTANRYNAVSGTFDMPSAALRLDESQTREVDGTPQETRIAGHYHCTPL